MGRDGQRGTAPEGSLVPSESALERTERALLAAERVDRSAHRRRGARPARLLLWVVAAAAVALAVRKVLADGPTAGDGAGSAAAGDPGAEEPEAIVDLVIPDPSRN
jgi:hypothetical protein